MDRKRQIARIERAIGSRRLIWFGTRGTDASPLRCIRQFAEAYSLSAPLALPSWSAEQECCLELLSERRVDLNSYTIDTDGSEAATQLHQTMMRSIANGALVATYRSCHFLSAAALARSSGHSVLGMFFGLQSAFDHKPWVETSLRNQGIRTIDWEYFSDHDWDRMRRRLVSGALVLRKSYTDGGAGLRLVTEINDYKDGPERLPDRLIAASRLLEPNVPMNVGGCVWNSGLVTVHAPSVQLIGYPVCTDNRFGYCGNDFASPTSLLPGEALDSLQDMVLSVGGWLHSKGYRGAFGVDALYHKRELYLTEVNPRFQGCSATAADVQRRLGLADVYLDHIAAFLDLEPPGPRPSLKDQATLQGEMSIATSQVIAYAETACRRRDESTPPTQRSQGRFTCLPRPYSVVVEPNGMLFKYLTNDRVLIEGSGVPELDARIQQVVERAKNRYFEQSADETTLPPVQS